MNKLLLPVVRHEGDILFSINGEQKVSFDIGGVWSNLQTTTITGDAGCVYPKDPSSTDVSALAGACKILENISIVPFENDSRFAHLVTPDIQTWVKETLPAEIKRVFRENHTVFKGVFNYVDPESKEVILAVAVEIVTNAYATSIFEAMKDIAFLGTVKSSEVGEDGKITYTYTDAEGNENTIFRDMGGDVMMIGVDSFSNATRLFTALNHLIITNDNFVHDITETTIHKQ